MVYRVYVEKRPGLTAEADALAGDIRTLLGISSLEGLRLLNRYDVENISPALFDHSVKTILSEPQLDVVTDTLPEGGILFAVEYLPGQFDQRADSAAQCIQILSQGERPLVRSARVYHLTGNLSAEDVAAIKKYLINPVEAREASLEPFDTLAMDYAVPRRWPPSTASGTWTRPALPPWWPTMAWPWIWTICASAGTTSAARTGTPPSPNCG